MVGIIDLMSNVQGGFDKGRERGQQSYLGRLASQAYGAAPDQQRGYVQQAIATNPEAGFSIAGALEKSRQTDFSQLGQAAAIMSSMPEDQRADFYASKVVPLAHQSGFKVPTAYDPRFQPMIDRVAQVAGSAGVGGNVQSTYVDAQGNRVAIMRDGSTQLLGQNAPSNQIIDTGNGFFGVNKTSLQAAPVMVGGQPQQRAPGEVPFSIDPSLPPQVQAQIRANPDAGSAQGIASLPAAYGGQPQQGGGQQLTSAPKPSDTPDTFAPLSQDEVAQMGMPPGTVAQRNLKTGEVKVLPGTAQPKTLSPAQQMKLNQNRKKETRMVESMDASFDQSVKLIDDILAQRDRLGGVTGIGALGAKIPGTPWADLDAKLTTLKARSAFGSLQEMRANSPTGGALGNVSERELDLLQNAETQLKSSQSPEALAAALEDYKRTLLNAKRRLHAGVDEFYEEAGGESESPQTNSVLRYNPATGDFE